MFPSGHLASVRHPALLQLLEQVLPSFTLSWKLTKRGHQLTLFRAQQGLDVNWETFLQNQKHKHETWTLQDYKAACWLFTHLFRLQHIVWGETETRIQTGDTAQSLTQERV